MKEWRPVDIGLGVKVGEVLRVPTWYAQNSSPTDQADFRHPPHRSNRTRNLRKENELLRLLGGEVPEMVNRNYPAEKSTTADLKMEQGYPFYYLTYKVYWRRAFKGRWLYPMDCECGAHVRLTAEEALKRNRLGLGCGRRHCYEPVGRVRIWYEPKLALRLQLIQIRNLRPDLIEGEIDEECIQQQIKEIYANEHTSTQIKAGKWWISLLEQGGKLVHDSLTLTEYPDEALFPDGQVHVLLGDWPATVNEICELYPLSREKVMEKRLTTLDDEMLIEELLGEIK